MNQQNPAAKPTSSRRMSGNTESIHRCAFECIMIMILMMICSKRKAVQKKSRPEVIELHFVSFLRAVCTFYNPLEADHAPGHLLRILHIFFKYFRVFQSIFESFPKYFSDCPRVFFRIFQRLFQCILAFHSLLFKILSRQFAQNRPSLVWYPEFWYSALSQRPDWIFWP